MEEINMNENSSYKNIKKYNSLLPNIRYNNTSQKENFNKHLNEMSNPNYNVNYSEFKTNNKMNNFNEAPYTPYNNDNYTLKKYNSQMNLFNNYNNYNINNNQNQNEEEDFANFFGKIKISNFYSSAEIILLIENILNELNFKKNYSFTIKDSLITFSFGNANKALEVFKKLNMEKLNNNYYRNLMIDINLDIKNNHNNKVKEADKIIEEFKEEKGNMLYKKISPQKNKLKQVKNINKLKNLKSYNLTRDNLVDKNFEGIYKDYIEYFKKRKEERRKKELSYVNGKNYSLQASTPYVENDNRNYFVDNLRKYKGNDISPSKFNGYIDKASIKLI